MTDSTSSSDEEDRKKLLDAVDKSFISDGMFGGKTENSGQTELKDTLPPSLRSVESDRSDHNVTGLNLTPEFQHHVAKQLSAMLDKQLKDVEPGKKQRKKKRSKDRVKLLHSSATYIATVSGPAEDVNATLLAKRKATEREENSEEECLRIREAVVNSDWVTSGEAIKGWAKSTKGEVIIGEHTVGLRTSDGKKKKKKKKKLDDCGERKA